VEVTDENSADTRLEGVALSFHKIGTVWELRYAFGK
jgi:hypothetical protein